MIKSTTLRVFPSDWDWRRCLPEASSAGYQGVEINFDGRLGLDCSIEELSEIRQSAQDNGVKVVSVYSRQQWLTPISSRNPEKSRRGAEAIRQLIRIAALLEAEMVLVIPGVVSNAILSQEEEIVPYDEVYDRSSEILSALAGDAAEQGVVLALENVPGKFLLSPLEMRAFIDCIGSPAAAAYLDIPNCIHNHGYPEHWIAILGHRIKNVHLKDYRTACPGMSGFVDIFEGDVDWSAVCRALADISYTGPLTSEVLPAYRHHPERLWRSAAEALSCLEKDISDYMERKRQI
ncbi:MAG: sugar phosphate isomerase/epimerase [bacterium]|nr:sugar phosphate isomerase/epimerase [bacterium]